MSTSVMLTLCYVLLTVFVVRWIDKKFLNNLIGFNGQYFIFYFLVMVYTTITFPIYFFIDRGDCNGSKRMSPYLGLITHVLGIDWKVRGTEHMGSKEGGIIVMNHQSSLDILGMFHMWKYFHRMAPIAKKEIFYFWPFGLSAYYAGVVFIDRNNSHRARKQLAEISRMMHTERTKLLFFPEGTRNTKRCVNTFKKGAFHMAVECQVPILPIVVSPYYFINPRKRFFGSGPMIIEALPAIPTEGLTNEDVPRLTQQVHDVMEAHYETLSSEIIKHFPSDYPGL